MNKFALQNSPIFYQLTKHINNLVGYWHKDNAHGRMIGEQWLHYTTSDILYALAHTNEYIGKSTLHRRCEQIHNFYGTEVVTSYLKAVYGTSKVG